MLRTLNRTFLKSTTHGLKIITRLRNTTGKKTARRNRTENPGVNLQTKVLSENEAFGTNVDLDDLEADFAHLHLTHKEHVEQRNAMRERETYVIVGRKYFNEKYPNFLTWNDKQQIRQLHHADPDEWTVEKLCDGFPALPETIKKIVKSSWTKRDANKIRNHDASVQKNWESFRRGELDLPADLSEHLRKFSERKLNLEPFRVAEKTPVVRREGEFSQIIKSYEQLKNRNKETNSQEDTTLTVRETEELKKPRKETYVTISPEEYVDKKSTTLSELKRGIEVKIGKGKELTVDEQLILQHNDVEVKNVDMENPIVDISYLKNSHSVQVEVKSKRDYKHLEYPEKISIPKDKIKKGYTYKLNDCFYDHKGYFLYRVPGMEN